jgi:ATP-dependent exoDNAse (exonuclease V) beta subunit
MCEIASYQATTGAEDLSNIRVLYVAMTRALRCLSILHHADTELTDHMRRALEQVSSRLAA